MRSPRELIIDPLPPREPRFGTNSSDLDIQEQKTIQNTNIAKLKPFGPLIIGIVFLEFTAFTVGAPRSVGLRAIQRFSDANKTFLKRF